MTNIQCMPTTQKEKVQNSQAGMLQQNDIINQQGNCVKKLQNTKKETKDNKHWVIIELSSVKKQLLNLKLPISWHTNFSSGLFRNIQILTINNRKEKKPLYIQIVGLFDFNDVFKIINHSELTNTTLQTPKHTHTRTLHGSFHSPVLFSQYLAQKPLTSGTAIIFWVTMLSRMKENATWSSSSSKGLIAFSKRANLSSF